MKNIHSAKEAMIQTLRLKLEMWREDHREVFAALHADPEVMADQGGPIARTASDAKFDRYRAAIERSGISRWALQDRQGSFLGYCGVMLRDDDGYFPEKALRLSTSGSANVRCTVGVQGDLLGCWVVDETPSAFGFAPAALFLTTFVQMKPMTKDSASTVGRSNDLHAAFDARNGKITLSTGQ